MTINKYWVKPKKRHNKTYRGSLTKRRKEINTNRAIVLLLAWCVFTTTYAFAMTSNKFVIDGTVVKGTRPASELDVFVSPERAESEMALPEQVKMYREFTAYNAGDPYQCDNTPCISASGDNICALLAQGQIIFASNEFPIGTKLYVEGIGKGTVLDRMNSRFKTRIDYAMQAHEKPRAIAFGLQTLKIKILK